MNIKQKIILKKLALKNGQRFSELLRCFNYEDKFSYHIKQLLINEYINKREGLYFVTKKGLSESIKINKDFTDLTYKTVKVLFICKFNEKYLIKKHFYNDKRKVIVYGLPNLSGLYGLKLLANFQHHLFEKYGIKGDLSFICVQNYFEYSTDNTLLFDNILMVFDVKVSDANKTIQGFEWLTKDEIRSFSNIHSTVEDFVLNDSIEKYSEREVTEDYIVEKSDL